MRAISRFAAISSIVATLATCSADAVIPTPGDGLLAENSGALDDEDGNGLVDCGDPACADMPTCQPVCANGKVEAGEGCDDGNIVNGDGCDANCTPTGCGNGITTCDEVCDDGNVVDGDGCDGNCTPSSCGNGVVAGTEVCDDGNMVDGDGCDGNCRPTGCGSGVVTAGEQCDDGNLFNNDGCDNDCTFSLSGVPEYIKASNTGAGDQFGYDVALSADGSTLAIGARAEDSMATGIDGDQADNSASTAGAVYVFSRSGAMWIQQGYLKAANAGADDQFGFSVALSDDGSTLAVGARFEDSAATGINGSQDNNAAASAGAVYVFTRNGATWSQQAYVKASNTGADDHFGSSVALSSDGSTLAVGSLREDSAAIGINGNQASNSASASGAVYVFSRTGTTWSQQAYIKASNTEANDQFGCSVALSGDGLTLAVGANGEGSHAVGIEGDQADNSAGGSGAVYVFTRTGATWSQQVYIKASNTDPADEFGYRVALSGNGSTLAVSARFEDSAATGVAGDQTNNTAGAAGAVYVLARSGTTWSQQAYVKASNTGADDRFGTSLALSADGSTVVVGAPNEDSSATGIEGDQRSDVYGSSGAVYVLKRSGTTWSQRAYVKASNTGVSDLFGSSVALSDDGSTLAVGAIAEDGSTAGIDGDQSNNLAADAGAVYVFH